MARIGSLMAASSASRNAVTAAGLPAAVARPDGTCGGQQHSAAPAAAPALQPAGEPRAQRTFQWTEQADAESGMQPAEVMRHVGSDAERSDELTSDAACRSCATAHAPEHAAYQTEKRKGGQGDAQCGMGSTTERPAGLASPQDSASNHHDADSGGATRDAPRGAPSPYHTQQRSAQQHGAESGMVANGLTGHVTDNDGGANDPSRRPDPAALIPPP